jgi:predicted RNase H-like nuclease (RuvC/YqgF family)
LSTTFSFHTPDTTSSNFSRSPDHLHTSPQQTILNLRTELALALNTVSKLSEENFDLSERVRELEDENQVLLIQMRDLEREQSIDHGWDEDKEGLTRDWQRKVVSLFDFPSPAKDQG